MLEGKTNAENRFVENEVGVLQRSLVSDSWRMDDVVAAVWTSNDTLMLSDNRLNLSCPLGPPRPFPISPGLSSLSHAHNQQIGESRVAYRC